jgi:hypothetical protein
MEGIFLHVIVGLVKGIVDGIDGLFEKTLSRAIPVLDLLLEDPEKAFDDRSIIIGPRRKYCTAALVGLMLAIVGVLTSSIVFLILQNRPGGKNFDPLFWWGTLGPVGLCCFIFGFRLLRGGYCILTREGVEFRYGRRVVCCSWSVFHAWGQPVLIEESNMLLLPISPDATDSIVELNKEESEVKRNGMEVHTPQWETRSHFEAALKPLYVVKIQDLGALLLRIGQILGDSQTVGPARISKIDDEGQSNPLSSGGSQKSFENPIEIPSTLSAGSRLFPIALREKNGWLRMSLTRFHLPYYCCYCTVPTRKTFLFQARNEVEGNYYPIHLPTCDQCRDRAKRRRRNLHFLLLVISLAVPIALILFLDNLWPELLVLVVASAVLSLAVMWIITQRLLGLPAKVRYSSKKGTLHLRFRNRDYERLILDQRVTR